MKNEKKSALHTLIEEYMIMTEAIAHTGKKARRFNTDVDIFRSEIHIIQLVGDYKHLHISDIARKFGVTKGAISQIVKKLEKKELIRKERDEMNNTRTLISLTEKGKRAHRAHEKHHEKHDREMFSFLQDLTGHELEVIHMFIKQVVAMTDKHL